MSQKTRCAIEWIDKPDWMAAKACGILSAEQLAFFHKYGFVLIKGLHSEAQMKKAQTAAETLSNHAAEALDDGKGEQAFAILPEGSRSTWGRCTDPNLTQLFEFPENMYLVREVIGHFEFKHHPGPGFYTIRPAFLPLGLAPNRGHGSSKPNGTAV